MPLKRLVVGVLVATGVAVTGPTLPAQATIRAVLVASGFTRPLGLAPHPTDGNVLVVFEQAGRVRLVRDGQIQSPDFIDLTAEIASGGEQGLLGMAFAPDFSRSGRVFFSFTNRSGHSVIARFTTLAGTALRLDAASRFDLRWPTGDRFIAQPFSNHNGGHIAFGPDGLLYVGLGDGGSANDPFHHAQNPLSLLGKFLRLDVGVASGDPAGYVVPPSNPFVGRPGVLPEIWSMGLRNPWRWSFDDPAMGGTGALTMGDVGQNAWEEINYEPSGAGGRNYGWRNREGAHANVGSLAAFSDPLRDPIFEYGRSAGQSVTGGGVYRGQALGQTFRGRYFFADFLSNRVWSLALSVNPTTREATAANLIDHTAALGAAAASVASFGVDLAGELYVMNYGGSVHRLTGAGTRDGRARTGTIVGTAQPR